jgi:hypothetical protein
VSHMAQRNITHNTEFQLWIMDTCESRDYGLARPDCTIFTPKMRDHDA